MSEQVVETFSRYRYHPMAIAALDPHKDYVLRNGKVYDPRDARAPICVIYEANVVEDVPAQTRPWGIPTDHEYEEWEMRQKAKRDEEKLRHPKLDIFGLPVQRKSTRKKEGGTTDWTGGLQDAIESAELFLLEDEEE